MFFILSKALLFLISPFFWFISSISGYIWIKNPKWKNRAKFSLIFIFLFFTNTSIFGIFCGIWEIHGTKISEVKPHDVGIVLTGMAEYDNSLHRLSLRRGGDRIWQAVTLYKTGKIKKIIISGDSGFVNDRGLHEATQFKSVLLKWGIPEEDLLAEEISKNTHENAVETKKLIDKHSELSSILLITSGTHMRRSMACFEKQGMNCTPFSTDLYTSKRNSFYWDQYFVPNVSNFSSWNSLMKEWVGYFSYWVVGYV